MKPTLSNKYPATEGQKKNPSIKAEDQSPDIALNDTKFYRLGKEFFLVLNENVEKNIFEISGKISYLKPKFIS